MSDSFDLYVDDSGSRRPDRADKDQRRDGVDAFALGGFLIPSESAFAVGQAVKALRDKLEINSALHSTEIRSKKGNFAWIDTDRDKASKLYAGIDDLVQNLPGWVTAAVVHRPGYNKRYKEKFGDNRWWLCKTAYPILLERSAKFAAARGRRLKVYIEMTGKVEDRALGAYHSQFVTAGHEFDKENAEKYAPLEAGALAKIAFKKPQFIKKTNELAQLADLVLYPVIKGKYDAAYRSYVHIRNCGKLIDDNLDEKTVNCGVKYSCFDEGTM